MIRHHLVIVLKASVLTTVKPTRLSSIRIMLKRLEREWRVTSIGLTSPAENLRLFTDFLSVRFEVEHRTDTVEGSQKAFQDGNKEGEVLDAKEFEQQGLLKDMVEYLLFTLHALLTQQGSAF